MKTVLTTFAIKAAEFIRSGGLTAFPTETVYGLGADVFNESALAKVFAAKGRPVDNPLIVHIGEKDQIGGLVSYLSFDAAKLVEAFFPGPLTIVTLKSDAVPAIATAGLDSVGIRMPGNELAHEFLRHCGTPVAAPSANLSGRPSPTTWQAVVEDLDGRIDCILQSEDTEVGLESTVVDCTGEIPLILRAGAVTLEQLQAVVPETKYASLENSEAPKSPGLKHKHYTPKADVLLIDNILELSPGADVAYIGLENGAESMGFGLVKICRTVPEYAHSVFEFFRECDRRGVSTIYCQRVAAEGLGTALMDRLERAAQS